MAFCSNLRRNLQNLKMILQYYLFRIFVDNQYIIRQNSCILITFIRHCKISQVSFAKKILASILIFLMLQECISQKSYIEIMQRNSKYWKIWLIENQYILKIQTPSELHVTCGSNGLWIFKKHWFSRTTDHSKGWPFSLFIWISM